MPDRQTTIRLNIEVGNILLPRGTLPIKAQVQLAPGSQKAVAKSLTGQIEAFLSGTIGGTLARKVASLVDSLTAGWANVAGEMASVGTAALALAAIIAVLVAAFKYLSWWMKTAEELLRRLATAFRALVKGIYDVNRAILSYLAIPFRAAVGASVNALEWLVDAAGRAAAAVYDLAENTLRRAVIVGADFEQQVANTATAMGLFGDAGMAARPGIEAAAIALTRFTANLPSEAVKGFWDVVSAGFDKFSDTMAVTRAAITLANATLTPLADTVRITTSILQQFSMGTDQANRVVNALAAASVKTATDIPKIMESMKYAGPVAAAFGISLEETLAIVGLFAQQGILASQAGTALRVVLTDLSRITKPTSDAFKIFSPVLKKLGMDIKDLSPIYNDLGTILVNLGKVREAVGEKPFMEMIAESFSMRGYTGMLALINKGAGELERLKGEISGTNLAYQMQADQLRTLQGAWKILLNLWQVAQIQMSHGIGPALGGIVGWLQQLVDAASNMGIWERLGAVAGRAISAIAGPLQRLAGPVLDVVSFLLDYLGGALEVFLDALGGMGGELRVAFAQMPDLAPMMRDLASAVVSALPTVVGFLGQLPALAGAALNALGKVGASLLTNALPAFVQWVTMVGPMLATIFTNIGMAFGQFLSTANAEGVTGAQMLVTWFQNLLQFGIDFTAWLPQMIPGILAAMTAFQGWANTLMDMGREFIPQFWAALELLLPSIDKFVTTYLPILRVELTKLSEIAQYFATTTLPTLVSAFQTMAPDIIRVLDAIAGAVKSLGDTLANLATVLAKQAPEIAALLEKALGYLGNHMTEVLSVFLKMKEIQIYLEGLKLTGILMAMGEGQMAAQVLAMTAGAVGSIGNMRRALAQPGPGETKPGPNPYGVGGGGGRASGGPVRAGRSYVVGEKGPEVFTPMGAGTISSNWMMRQSSAEARAMAIAKQTLAQYGPGWEALFAPGGVRRKVLKGTPSWVPGPKVELPKAPANFWNFKPTPWNPREGKTRGWPSIGTIGMAQIVAYYAKWLADTIGPQRAKSLIDLFGMHAFANWAGGNFQGDVMLAIGRAVGFAKIHGKRASGGPVAAGVPYKVGEGGAETFIPSQNGYIAPHGTFSNGPYTLVMQYTDWESMKRGVHQLLSEKDAQESHLRATAGASWR